MDYSSCRKAITQLISTISTTGKERVSLDRGQGRVTAAAVTARIPQPEFRQSMRDGFVIARPENTDAGDKVTFPVNGMIQAGKRCPSPLFPGQACRIMTGGMVPEGGVRVIQQEDCEVDDDFIHLPSETLYRKNTFIQEQGCDIAVGTPVVSGGTILKPEHISLLASVGCEEIEVYRRPRVGFLCTGSELVDTPQELHPGLKVSSNKYLLDGLIRQCGAEPAYLGTVQDSAGKLDRVLKQLSEEKYDVMISTGGMGPGKYDLIEQSFIDTGGEIIYNGLNLRPGKATLCGTLGRTIFFGLPGPPTAVRALMNAIVGPALLQLQGAAQEKYPKTIQAHLAHPITIKRPGVMQLRGARLYYAEGKCMVSVIDRLEPPDCYIVIEESKSEYDREELVNAQLVETLLL